MTVLCLGGFFRQFFFSKISVPSLFFFTIAVSFFSPRITGAEKGEGLAEGKGTNYQNPDNTLLVYPLWCCGIDIRDPKCVGQWTPAIHALFCTGFLGSASRTSAGHGSDRGACGDLA